MIHRLVFLCLIMLFAACTVQAEPIAVTRVVTTAVAPTSAPPPPVPTMAVDETAVALSPTPPPTPTPPTEIMMEGWLTYENDFYGYRFSYPTEAKISVLGFTGFPTEELPDGLTSDEYSQQLEDALPDDICVSVSYRSGFVTFLPAWEAGGKYTGHCGVTGAGDYDVTVVTETLTIDGSNYAAQGSVIRERDETAAWHNEIYFINLDDAFWIQYGSAYGNEAYFRGIEETLRQIVMSFRRVEGTTAVPRATAPLPTNPQTYFNSELGYSLQYGEAWQLAIENYEGSVQLVSLSQGDYELRIWVRLPTDDENIDCGGMFSEDIDFDSYWHTTIARQTWWRPKAELGVGMAYDENTTFLDVIAPVAIYDEPDRHGFMGEYSCLLPVDGRWLDIDYRLGASTAELAAGDYDVVLLGEMDNVVASLTFVEPAPKTADIICTRPDDIQMIGVEIVNDPVPCVVWQDITDDETGFWVMLTYEQSGESFRYELPADSNQLVLPTFDAPRLQESAEQCHRRQSFQVEITAVRSAGFGNWLIASLMANIECNPAALPTATPGM